MSDRGGGQGGGRRRRKRFRDRDTRNPAQGSPAPTGAGGNRGQHRVRDRQGGDLRRRRGKNRPAAPRNRGPEYVSVIVLPENQAALCPLCGTAVRDAVSALCYGQDKLPAHFDCVMETLRTKLAVEAGERLCYLGGGSFGVVRSPQGEGRAPFTIRDRVPYEEEPGRPDWRKGLDAVASRHRKEAAPGPASASVATQGPQATDPRAPGLKAPDAATGEQRTPPSDQS